MAGVPRARPGQLKCQWGKVAESPPDLIYLRAADVPPSDMDMLHDLLTEPRRAGGRAFGARLPSLLQELDARGYDISTLKISVEKKRPDIRAARVRQDAEHMSADSIPA